MGIRGTDVEIALAEAATGGNTGTYLKVNEGAAILAALDGSTVAVEPGQVAFGAPDTPGQGGTRSLRPLGRLFMFGGSSFAPSEKRRIWPILAQWLKTPKLRTFEMLDRNRGAMGINLGHLWEETERVRVMFEKVIEKVGEGTLVPVVDKVFPFSEAAAAHAYMQSRNNFGKVLLTP